MSEMVERVARAMHDPNEIVGNAGARDSLARQDWEELSEAARSRFRSYARAAIAAMREPTVEMLRPGGDKLAYFDFHRDDNAAGIWRAMVDAALGKLPA